MSLSPPDEPIATDSQNTHARLVFFWLMSIPMVAALLFGLFVVAPVLVPVEAPVEKYADLFYDRFWLNACVAKSGDKVRFVWAITVLPLMFWAGLLVLRKWHLDSALARKCLSRPWVIAACAVQGLLATTLAFMEFRQDPRILEPGQKPLIAIAMMIAVLGIAWWCARNPGRFQKAALLLDRPAGRVACFLVVGILATWELRSCFVTAQTFYARPAEIWYNASFTFGEYAAVYNGRTMLVDFFGQYHRLVPYLFIWYFNLFGLNITAFSVLMIAQMVVGLLLVLDLLRRFCGSMMPALLLGIPIIAISAGEHYYIGSFAMAPIREMCVWLVGWMMIWYLAKPSAGKRTLVLFIASLVAINNTDYGIIALGAAVITMAMAGRRTLWPTRAELLELVGSTLIGVAGAMGLYSLLTYARSGHWPDWAQAVLYIRINAMVGYYNLPTPRLGTHWVFYATQMAAVCVGLAGLAKTADEGSPAGKIRDENPRLICPRLTYGSLVFFGVFGAGALSYFMARSCDATLRSGVFMWAMSLALMGWLLWRSWWSEASREGSIAMRWLRYSALIPMVGIWLLGWTYIGGVGPEPITAQTIHDAEGYTRLVNQIHSSILAAHAKPGDKVCAISEMGHVYTAQRGVQNVFPYDDPNAVQLKVQIDQIDQAIRVNDVRLVYGTVFQPLRERLLQRGFVIDPELSRGQIMTFYRPDQAKGTR